MIEWRDEGILLAVRPHGETSAIAEAFCRDHGRHAGVVLGGVSRRMRPFLQPGVLAQLGWRARLDEHLGHFAVEPIRNRAATALGDRVALAGIGAVAALLASVLPERAAHPALYDRTNALLDLLGEREVWPLAYLQWEMAVLEEMGFGLDLNACAVTGARVDLAYVSPRTGRAVSRAGAGAYAPRLLPLPPVLRGEGEADAPAIGAALDVTGHFLRERLLPEGRELPAARARLVEALARDA
ncbi:DNA repair protein RecO [Rubellimicrobium aerolatum]|uniref:DNA repair protein RecO n=1 Tax=Rubellimicrobium aerolatum TaxID=490979 RepID=A0ABW0SD19_9RHOB|nr:DNA repair protein RecO [Rubellimicrobium aerolatum]MBP1806732.1 DNA repair protein RecO (recombination protein O) [Rubellimicrobium aerolatum]